MGEATTSEPRFEWKAPAQELFWFQDAMHLPHALSPLDATMLQPAFTAGASNAISRLSMPITGLRADVVNGYVYLATLPAEGSRDELAARFQEMQHLTGVLGSTVLRDWRETFEPQVLEECRQMLDFDYEGASIAAVAVHVRGFYDRLVKLWDIHMRVNIPPMNAVFGLEEFLSAVVGPDAVKQSRQLLGGFENKSQETGEALWTLSRWVREDASLAQALLSASASDGLVKIDHPRAGEFAALWADFLDRYGWRSNRFMEFAHPSWREDQSTPLTQLKGFIAKPDSADPYNAHRQQAEDRERLTAEMEARLPEEAKGQFRAILSLAQQYLPIAEDHNFTIDQKSTMTVRHGCLQLGKRLVATGALSEDADIFYLTLAEIAQIASSGVTGDYRSLVKQRRDLQQAQEAVIPPLTMGTPPPADAPPDPLVSKFFGLGVEPKHSGRVISGMAASGGSVTGIARVLHSLDESAKLQPGDILVCKTTMPPWTPLFGIAAAVVTDAGGPLSHCAIVAREYRIPCVAGTQIGTREITDGMRLKVDGDAGTVEILS